MADIMNSAGLIQACREMPVDLAQPQSPALDPRAFGTDSIPLLVSVDQRIIFSGWQADAREDRGRGLG
jgi:hypothetical protein